ncbi:MAG: DUF2889 domain-containing protein [Gammaproteobacteria bacterium]|nr:DUF2889 domain-containing protein [Gammaproteobacteria bacterium]
MPLTPSTPRRPLHERRIHCAGYEREDGLFDIEAHLFDAKQYPFHSDWRGPMPPGTPVHDMWLRVTIDAQMVIHDVQAGMDHSPYPLCPAIVGNFKRLVGLRIAPGFRREVHKRVGRLQGCTHLVELLGPIGTTAYQTLTREDAAPQPIGTRQRPYWLDTCHVHALDSPVTRQEWPEFYTGD